MTLHTRDPLKLRLELCQNGFAAIPVNGKAPTASGWRELGGIGVEPTEEQIRDQTQRGKGATNTGIVLGKVIVFDNDVDSSLELALKVNDIIMDVAPEITLIRYGDPKRAPALVARVEERVGKEVVYGPDRHVWNKEKREFENKPDKLEVLADGQQFVAFGIHPGSGKPYRWEDETPLDVPLEELPVVTAEQLKEIRRRVSKLLGVPVGHTPSGIKSTATGGGGTTGVFPTDGQGKITDNRDELLFRIVSQHARELAKDGHPVDRNQVTELSIRDFSEQAVVDEKWASPFGAAKLREKVARLSAQAEEEARKNSGIRWTDEPPTVQRERISLIETETRLKNELDTIACEVLSRKTGDSPGPVKVIRGQPGLGKSKAMGEVIKKLTDAGRRVLYLSPTHKLAHEAASDLRALGINAKLFGGFLAPVDPEDIGEEAERYCRRPAEAKQLLKIGLTPHQGLCGVEATLDKPSEDCAFQDQCKRWAMEKAHPDVWVAPANFLLRSPFPGAGNIDFIVVDETSSAVLEVEEHVFTLKDLAVVRDVPKPRRPDLISRRVRSDRNRTADLHGYSVTMRNIVRDTAPGTHLCMSGISPWSMEPGDDRNPLSDVKRALALEAERRDFMPPIRPHMDIDGLKRAMRQAPLDVQRFVAMWIAILEVLESEGDEPSGRLVVIEKNGEPALLVRARQQVHLDWAGIPIVWLDATAPSDQALSQILAQPVETVADLHAEVPANVEISQVLGAPVSKAALGLIDQNGRPVPVSTAAEHPVRNANAIADLIRMISLTADEDGIGLIASKKTKELLLELVGDEARSKIIARHYGAVAGTNQLADVDTLIAVGCDLPPPKTIEDTAEGLFGRVVERRPAGTRDWFYERVAVVTEMRDSRKFEHDWYRHSSPAVDELLRLFGLAQLIQGAERCRIARRGIRDRPCSLIVLCDAPIGYPISRVHAWNEVAPNVHHTMVSHGFSTGSADLLHGLLPSRFKSVDAARSALRRAETGPNTNTIDTRDNMESNRSNPLLNTIKKTAGSLIKCHALQADDWTTLEIQRSGPGRKPKRAAFHKSVDAEIFIRSRLGSDTAVRPVLENQTQIGQDLETTLDIELVPDLVRRELDKRGVSVAALARLIGWSRESLSRWFSGKRELPVKYRHTLIEWLQQDPPARSALRTAQLAVDNGTFPALISDHLANLPDLVAQAMAERGIGSGRLGNLLGIPFFVVEAFITSRTSLTPERAEALALWVLDDGQPTFADRLEALVHELLNPPPPEPIVAPSLFGDAEMRIHVDLLNEQFPGPLGPLSRVTP